MKYLLTITLTLVIVACGILTLTLIEVKPSPKSNDIIIPQESGTMTIQSYKFSYEDHDYIYFKQGYGQTGTAGVVHDPACQCHEQ